jgi:hypothetical protein
MTVRKSLAAKILSEERHVFEVQDFRRSLALAASGKLDLHNIESKRPGLFRQPGEIGLRSPP